MSDETERHLEQLSPETRDRAYWLIWAFRTAGVPLVITSSRRTPYEQEQLVLAGRSRTLRSKHLEGKAFDVDVYGLSRDSIPRWFWDVIGPWAEEQLGLRWGGRFTSLWDPGHFESPL